MAPCQDYVSREEYRAHVDKALEFLNGNYNMILNDLQKKMEILPSALSRLLRRRPWNSRKPPGTAICSTA